MGWILGASAFFCSSLFASWPELLEKGWKPPSEYFIYGYSESVPPYYAGARAYERRSATDPQALKKTEAYREIHDPARPGSFLVSRYEEERHLRPGLEFLATQWLKNLKLETGYPAQRSVIAIAPLTLSRTQHDIGRIHPWTVYGGAELDWEKLFWTRSTFPRGATRWLCTLVRKALDESIAVDCDLHAAGLRVLSSRPSDLPKEIVDARLVLSTEPTIEELRDMKYLLTFAPIESWPEAVRKRYEKQKLEAIPHPATLLAASSPLFEELAKEAPEARQLPLAQELSRYAAELAELSFYGLRALDVSRRRHRFKNTEPPFVDNAIGRDVTARTDDVESAFHQIFVPLPELLGLYGKPIARNVQLWGVTGSLKGKWILDGPQEDAASIERTRRRLEAAFEETPRPKVHYRNYYPPMELNGFQARWYRPLVAWQTEGATTVDFSLPGAVRFTREEKAVWLAAEVNDRDAEAELAKLVDNGANPETTALNARKLFEFRRLLDKPLGADFATALLNPVAGKAGYAEWKQRLPASLAEKLDAVVGESKTENVVPLTFEKTVGSSFEHDYWKKLVALSEATFMKNADVPAKNNTDCASTDAQDTDEHCRQPGLPDVARYLRRHYEALGLQVFSQKFRWKTDFKFQWGGLENEQENLIVVIPGKNRGEAIVMADHYDTAHMADIYDGTADRTLVGHRHASRGSDDNYSGTAALMEAAAALKDLALERDVWLVHITGEEFPADGLGTRALCQALVENRQLTDRPNPRITGVYQLDMVGHDTDKDADPKRAVPIFQLAPGRGERSAWLAWNAHRVATTWNRLSKKERWDAKHGRTKAGERFVIPAGKPPEEYEHAHLGKFLQFRAEIRPGWHFRSSLYNTDAQLYQDAGFPVVLFMENYDINRRGYHDTLDNLENIDLDYARGVVSIAIESVAQAAMIKP